MQHSLAKPRSQLWIVLNKLKRGSPARLDNFTVVFGLGPPGFTARLDADANPINGCAQKAINCSNSPTLCSGSNTRFLYLRGDGYLVKRR